MRKIYEGNLAAIVLVPKISLTKSRRKDALKSVWYIVESEHAKNVASATGA